MPPQITTYECADGTRITADVLGDPASPTIILAHGGGQTRHSWHGAMQALAKRGYHVINFDSRGHGDSDWAADGQYSVSARTQDMRAIVANLPGPMALVGASMGGGTAMSLVSEGFRPAALVLVDIVPRPETRGVARIIAFMRTYADGFANLEEAADAVAAYNPARTRPNSPAGLRKNLKASPDGRWRWHWDPKILKRDNDTERAEVAATLSGLSQAHNVPTLVVRGLHSDVVSDAGIAHFQTVMPHLEVFNVADAGHMVAGDRNDAFNAGIFTFLDRHMPIIPASVDAE